MKLDVFDLCTIHCARLLALMRKLAGLSITGLTTVFSARWESSFPFRCFLRLTTIGAPEVALYAHGDIDVRRGFNVDREWLVNGGRMAEVISGGANAVVGASPVPGRWTIDSVHSFVEFTIEHFTVALARGIAAGPTGTIVIADDPVASSVQASIDASTITTANAARDEKIQGPDVLDVDRFPTIDFLSTGVRAISAQRYALDGDLTMHGVTRPVTLDLRVNGVVADTWGKTRLGLSATTELKRSEFGAGEWGHRALASGGFMVPDSLRITLEIEATRDEESAES